MLAMLQRLALFPRFALRPDPRAGDGVEGLERLWVRTREGPVEAWWIAGDGVSAGAPGPAVIFAHGNGELIEQWPALLSPYRAMGVSLLLPEYRGYGRSAGAPSQASITSDLVELYDRIVSRPEVDRERMVLHGRSLGGGAVCALAARRMPAAMILQSTFRSIEHIVTGWRLPRFLVVDRFDNEAVVRSLRCPILVLHGIRDRLCPFHHAEALATVAAHSTLVAYDAEHNDCPPDWGAYWRDVGVFLRSAGIVRAERDA